MAFWNKEEDKKATVGVPSDDDVPSAIDITKEDSSDDIIVPLDREDDKVGQLLDEMASSQAVEYAEEPDVDPKSIIQSFLSKEKGGASDFHPEQQTPYDLANSPAIPPLPEEKIVEIDDDGERIFYLSSAALHYYLDNFRSWIEAYTAEIEQLPALCLTIPGSPIEYADAEVADEIAHDLGFDSYEVMAADADTEFTDFPFLRRFAEDTLEFAKKNWDWEHLQGDPGAYAEAIACEIRANWPGARSLAEAFFNVVLDDGEISDGKCQDDGEEVVMVGVKGLNENLLPESFAVGTEGDWEKVRASFEGYNKSKQKAFADDGSETVIPDDGLLSLAYLQCYEWVDRSWGKADKILSQYMSDVFTFCWACLSEDFFLIDAEQVQRDSEELEEIAEELRDESGQIQLIQIVPGDPEDVNTLDAKSRRFVELAEEQEDAARLAAVNDVIVRVIRIMVGTKQGITDMLVDEIITCIYAMSDLTIPRDQIRCMEKVRDAMMERFSKMAKPFKSEWKRYLSDDRDAAEKIKEGIPILGRDDLGNLVFAKSE